MLFVEEELTANNFILIDKFEGEIVGKNYLYVWELFLPWIESLEKVDQIFVDVIA